MSPRTLLALFAAASLAGCATPTQISWAPRADANLGADRAACTKVANDLNFDAPEAFTDGRYGVAAAMASRLDQGVKGGTVDRARDAVFEDCMVRKGWQKQ